MLKRFITGPLARAARALAIAATAGLISMAPVAQASQNAVVLPTTGTVSGLQMTQNINNALSTVISQFSGASAPASPTQYQLWADTTNSVLKIYDGTNWLALGSFSGGQWIAFSGGIKETAPTATGSANAFVLTYAPAPSALVTGQTYTFIANFTVSGTATLNINSLGAKNITKSGTSALSASDIVSGQVVSVVYDGTGFQMTSPIASASGSASVPVPVRQTVLQGAVDSNGLPTFLGTGSGLAPSIDGSTTPIVMTAANGFTGSGQLDRVGVISSSTSFPAVTGAKTISTLTFSTTTATLTTSTAHGLSTGATITVSGATPAAYNGTYVITVSTSTQFTYTMASNPGSNASVVGSYTVQNYLYGDIASNGSVTLGSTTIPPTYQWGGTYSTTNGAFTFNIQAMSGQVGNGSTAAQTYRVFIGEAQAGSSTVSSVTAYALEGRYRSAETPTLPSTSTTVSASHNIGVKPVIKRFIVTFTTAQSGYVVGDELEFTTTRDTAGVDLVFPLRADRLTMSITTSNSSAFLAPNPGGGVAVVITAANASYRFEAYRGW